MRVVSRCLRVLIASGVLVVGVAVLAVLSPSAAAAHGGPAIVCPAIASPPTCCPLPIAPASTLPTVAPCCPVPTYTACCAGASPTICCGSTCPAGITAVVNPSTVSEGANTTISGTLSGSTVGAQTVDLYEQAAGQSTFADVAQAQTSASGTYQFVRAVQTNAQWYTKAAGMQSPTVAESVTAAVALHASTLRPKAGTKVTFSGTVAPNHAGERVALQRLEQGQWTTIAQPKLTPASGFAVAEKLRRHTRARFRVVLAADARNALSVSPTVAITTH